MNFRTILHIVSFLLMVLAVGMGVSAAVGWWMDDALKDVTGVLWAALLTGCLGLGIWAGTRGEMEPTRRDGFAVVALGWIFSSTIGALPFLFTGAIPDVASAVFETTAGFTTTGGSVLSDCEGMARGVMFWRCLTQWFGGMGILVLCIAILPFLRGGAMQIFQAEVSGPTKDRLTPHIITTAKLLWSIYVGLSVLSMLALYLAGMSGYDAVCHGFGIVSTSGFSTRTASIAAYHSPLIEGIVLFFLLVGGMNFTLHSRFFREGQLSCYRKDREWRLYISIWLLLGLFTSIQIWHVQDIPFWTAIRYGFFNGASVMTTGGFTSADIAAWPLASRVALILAMIAGACSGSTSGGIKMIRCNLALRQASREIKCFIRPNAIYKIKYDGRIVDDPVISNISTFVLLWLIVIAVGTFCMTFFAPDIETALSAVASCTGNVGAGLGGIGPNYNYGWIPPMGKVVLTVCMLLGRLELYTLLVIFSPAYWRK